MAQIFPKSTNSISLLSLIVLFIVAGALLFGGLIFVRSPVKTHVKQFVQQPVAFSHKHHVQGAGLDCRFCHVSVEKSNTAGMPSTEVCMTCHSQLFHDAPTLAAVRESWQQQQPIAWNRVHDLPDYVFFNHAMHVKKGVSCLSCHGQINQMALTYKAEPMTMSWCLDCHTHPENYIGERKEVFKMPANYASYSRTHEARWDLIKKYHVDTARMRNCYECHR